MARLGKIWLDLTRGTWQDLARFDQGGHGKIWQDLARYEKGTWQDLVRFDKGDRSRFGKIWKDLTRGAMAKCGKI